MVERMQPLDDVFLHVAQAPEADDRSGGSSARPDVDTKVRILLADDNEDSATSLALLLSMSGHETRTARDGIEALEIAAAFRPHLVLLDIGMPRLNGYDTARRLRALAGGKKLVLAALSGWGQDEDRRRSTEAGFDAHFLKPANIADIERLIADIRGSRSPA